MPNFYFTDFSEYTSNQQPSDWTNRWDQGWNMQVVDDAGATGGKVANVTGTGSLVTGFFSWDAINADGERADVEILMKVRSADAGGGTNEKVLAVARASNPLATRTCYTLAWQIGVGYQKVEKFVDSTYSLINNATGFAHSYNTWYWVRARVEGTALKMKVWADGDPEPLAWGNETTDTDITAAGWVGIGTYATDQDFDVDVFSVATGGAKAIPYDASNTTAIMGSEIFEVAAAGYKTLAIPAGTDALLITAAGWNGGAKPLLSALSWDGSATKQVDTQQVIGYNGGSDSALDIYYITTGNSNWPGTGSQDLYFSAPGYNGGIVVEILYLTGVDPATPFTDVDSQAGGGSTFTSAMTAQADDLAIIAAYGYASVINVAPSGTGQIEQAKRDYNNASSGIGYEYGEGALQASGTNRYFHVFTAVINPAPASSGVTLTPAATGQSQSITATGVAVQYGIAPAAAAGAQSVTAAGVAVNYALTPASQISTQTTSATAVGVAYALAPSGMLATQSLSPSAVSVTYTLAPSGVVQGQSLTASGVNTSVVVSPAATGQAQTATASAISVTYQLSPAATGQGQTLSGANLGVAYGLTPASSLQSQRLTAPGLTVQYNLAPAGLRQGQVVSAAVVNTPGVFNITPRATAQAQQLGAAPVQVRYSLAPAATGQAQTATASAITFTYLIHPAGTRQAQAATATGLEIQYAVAPAAMRQAQRLEAAAVSLEMTANRVRVAVEPLYTITVETKKLYTIKLFN